MFSGVYGKFTGEYPTEGEFTKSYHATKNAIDDSTFAINDFQKIARGTIKTLKDNIHNIEGRYNYLIKKGAKRASETKKVEEILRDSQLQINILEKMKDMPTLIASSNSPVESPEMHVFNETMMPDRPDSPRSIANPLDQSRGGKKTRKRNKKGKKKTRRY
jgi:hypothetical protein